jgi:hypothetical protein
MIAQANFAYNFLLSAITLAKPSIRKIDFMQYDKSPKPLSRDIYEFSHFDLLSRSVVRAIRELQLFGGSFCFTPIG